MCLNFITSSPYWKCMMCFFFFYPLSRMSSPVQHTPSGAYILPNFPAQSCQPFYILLKSCEILSKEARSRKGSETRIFFQYQGLGSLEGLGLCNREDHFYFCRNYHCRTVVLRMWSENHLSSHDPPFSNYMSVWDWISTKTYQQIEYRSRHDMRIQLSSIKSDTRDLQKNKCHSSH